FNVPDLRGRVCAGLDNMGGNAAGRIGTVSTDSGTIIGSTLGSTGGSATHVQATAELAQHNHVDSGHTHIIPNIVETGSFATPISGGPNGISAPTNVSTQSGTANIQNTGSSSAIAWLQPTMMLGKILRVI